MKILCYDPFSGISGDMNLGAMLDLGIDKEYLVSELQKLNLQGWELVSEKDQRHGIGGTKVSIRLSRENHNHDHHDAHSHKHIHKHEHEHEHDHDHQHDHQHDHDHDHSHTHEHVHEHDKNHHEHRNLASIREIINKSSLSNEVKDLSMKIFMKVAEAEAKVHGIDVNNVHFHEVGAVDSIIDTVGAAICYCAIKPDAVYVTNIELGGGMVKCDHGLLPVPAPATSEIIAGLPVKTGGVDFEATTPTGAAILAALVTNPGQMPPLKILKNAYGVGQKEHRSVPNLLRVYLAESISEEGGHEAVQLETNIDDMNPEFYDYIFEKLFKAGASDVIIDTVIMKKGRPGSVLKVICEPGLADKMREIIFTESTSVGIRTFSFRKDSLIRKFEKIATEWGEVTIKKSYWNGKEVSAKPEYEEIKLIANKTGIPVKEVFAAIASKIQTNNK